MLEFLGRWASRLAARRLYEAALGAVGSYVSPESAHIVVLSAATYAALASASFLVYWFCRLTFRVADDCLRLLYIGLVVLVVYVLGPPLLALLGGAIGGTPAPPGGGWMNWVG